MIHNATRSWSGQPEYDAGIPADWPRDVRYIDGTSGDEGRIWFRGPHEMLTPVGRALIFGNIRRAIGDWKQNELIVLDLECGIGFPSPSFCIACEFHGLDLRSWDGTMERLGVDNACEAYELAACGSMWGVTGVAWDDFPHRHDGDSIKKWADAYVDHPWWLDAPAVIINFYNQHPGQDPAYVALGRKSMAHVAHRCAARRDVKVYATVCAQYEHGPGEYMTQDEWKATMDACAEHRCEPIIWGRWKDKAAADAMRRFMESGGIAAVEAAGLAKTQGGVIV